MSVLKRFNGTEWEALGGTAPNVQWGNIGGTLSNQTDLNNELSAITDMVSDAWNSATTYDVGQFCIYNNSLWRCLTQHSNQTPTEGTYWTEDTISNALRWKFVADVNGYTVITFPSNWSEIRIMVSVIQASGNCNGVATYTRDQLSHSIATAKGRINIISMFISSGEYYCVYGRLDADNTFRVEYAKVSGNDIPAANFRVSAWYK